ncbi:MAG: sulfatase [Anaerolineae bacterium]
MTRKRPNIIFLVLDTHRAERMSIYGYHKDTTPVIGELSEGATVFDWAIAPAAWTIPSHAAMFTGLYGTVHQANQSFTALPRSIPTLAELLQKAGYDTVGFCNNPLVGVLDNGLKRGFAEFFNYSGTFPDVPAIADESVYRKAIQATSRMLQKISIPIERKFGQSPLLLKLAMMPLFVPFWTRLGKFKGDTKQSLTDVADYLRYHRATAGERPLFMFINMMETHLPYYPPRKVLDKWVPYLRKDREARDFLQRFNTQSYRWVAPMIEPFTEMQHAVLQDVYDAEIAYQDRQLRRVFRYLRRSGELENTLLVIVSDHGESHGEHDFMGHAFVNYNEVVRVPLIIHYPEAFPAGMRVGHNISTRRIFHTILDLAGIDYEAYGHTAHELSLARSVEGKDHEPADEIVVSEAFPPQNFINVMEMNNPEAIDRFRVREMRRAIYNSHTKLMTVGGRPDEFFDVREDYFETRNLLDNPFGYENELIALQRRLEEFIVIQEAHRDGTAGGALIDYSDNPEILERLRGLGYIE